MLNISIFCEISSSLCFLSLLQLKWVIHDASQVFRSYAVKYLLPAHFSRVSLLLSRTAIIPILHVLPSCSGSTVQNDGKSARTLTTLASVV